MASFRLILGLGNPGSEYSQTRHNVGFMVADELARKLGASFERLPKAWIAEVSMGDSSLLLAKPRTFMNRSGAAAASLCAKHGIEPGAMLVVHDDLDLPFGAVRFKKGGGSGGKGNQGVVQC